MLDNTQQKGTLTELYCILDLTKLGIRCLTPVDESSKYDVVADLDGRFIRIQCKTASWVTDTATEKSAFCIYTCCQTTNTKSTTLIRRNSFQQFSHSSKAINNLP